MSEHLVRHRRGLKHVRVAFTGDRLTRYGGVSLLQRFFHRVRVRQHFRDGARFSQRNNVYSIPEMPIPTGQFAANEAYFHLLLFAYNLMNWMKRLCLSAGYRSVTMATLRRQLLMLPGEHAGSEFIHPESGAI